MYTSSVCVMAYTPCCELPIQAMCACMHACIHTTSAYTGYRLRIYLYSMQAVYIIIHTSSSCVRTRAAPRVYVHEQRVCYAVYSMLRNAYRLRIYYIKHADCVYAYTACRLCISYTLAPRVYVQEQLFVCAHTSSSSCVRTRAACVLSYIHHAEERMQAAYILYKVCRLRICLYSMQAVYILHTSSSCVRTRAAPRVCVHEQRVCYAVYTML
jgi:hypothetical protein